MILVSSVQHGTLLKKPLRHDLSLENTFILHVNALFLQSSEGLYFPGTRQLRG